MAQITPLTRDCPATEIPSGTLHLLSAGTPVYITQSLGGSYTVSTGYGQMMRIDAKDADALGMEPPKTAEHAGEFSEQLVWDQLKTIFDPEIPVNIVDLGLVYSCAIITRNRRQQYSHHDVDDGPGLRNGRCTQGRCRTQVVRSAYCERDRCADCF